MSYEKQLESRQRYASASAGRANATGQRVPSAAAGIHSGTYRPGEEVAEESQPVDWSDWRNTVPLHLRIWRKKN